MNDVDAYALDVVSGRIPAGKYHRLSCERHLNDRRRENTEGFPFRFEYPKADRFFQFAARLKHYKGKQFAGKPIELTAAQRFRLGSIFGWRHVTTGLRRFTTAYNELPRKQGKTLEAAIVAIYVTFFEGEPGAEGYCIATKRQQAKLVFDAARKLVKSSGLAARISVFAHNLHREATEQKLEPIGADADSTDGLNPYLIITDEFHAHKTRDLVDVMESGTGARQTFLHFIITTAGNNHVTPCGEQHNYIRQILEGVLCDEATEATFGFIAHADPDDDWLDERTWAKANPHYGISVNPEDMRKLALKAKNIPSAAAEFKQKRLNLWVNASNPCLSIDGWRRGQSKMRREDFETSLEHESCYVGVDLASKLDLLALSLLFPPGPDRPKWSLIQRLWTPEATIADRAHRDRAPYEVWRQQGWLLTTPGVKLNHRVVRDALVELRERYDLELTGYDPWHADKLIDELIDDDGFPKEQLLEVPQTFAGMSSACLRMQAEIADANVDANDCPVTLWAVSNVVGQTDGKNNLMFSKKKSTGRIDPVIAPTIGMSLWLREHEGRSAYDDGNGLMVV